MENLNRVAGSMKGVVVSTLVLVMLAFQLYSGAVQAQERTIFLVGTNDVKNSFMGKWLEMIYTEAYKRLGFKIDYKGYPAKRASLLSDSGEVDGEISRVATYGKDHPNMIKVEEPHLYASFDAYGVDPTIKLDGWDSLKGTNYKVNYRLGVTLVEAKLPLVLPKSNLESVNSIESGLLKTILKRGDLFIDLGSNIEEAIITTESLKNSQLRKVGTMETIPAHSFLHKKNKDLAIDLSKVLTQMKAEGLVERYRKIAYKVEN